MQAVLLNSFFHNSLKKNRKCHFYHRLLFHWISATKGHFGDPTFIYLIQPLSYKSSKTEKAWQRIKINPIARYFRSLRWTPIPLGIGFALIAYQQLKHVRKRESSKLASEANPEDLIASPLSISLYTMLPLRVTSRFWGWVNSINLPPALRKPALNLFVTTYGCNVKEAVDEDLSHYKNLGEFFSRQLKKELRPIYPGECVVSPADGRVLHFGIIDNGLVEQVKGITYSLKSFLDNGELCNQNLSDHEYHQSLLHNPNNALYHCVIYLAPGDYHKFHSPVNWTIHQRKHFPGHLLSVRPGIVSWVAGLFNMNERVVYSGEWKYGFFSLTAVGATNVGSIRVFFDETLKTNKGKFSKGICERKRFNFPYVVKSKGDLFGEFNLGSTIVLIFEAPKNIQFNVNKGQKIKYGELLSACKIKSLEL